MSPTTVSLNLSQHHESALCIRWPNYWSFGFSISPFNEHSFRIDSFELCSPRDSQESSPTLQFKSINYLALSFLHSPTLTSIAFTRWTFVGKLMSLLFNMLSRLVIAFLPRSKRLLISWLQLLSAGAQENKISHCFQFFHFYLP